MRDRLGENFDAAKYAAGELFSFIEHSGLGNVFLQRAGNL